MKLGVQFYTLREFCQDLDSFSESLKKVADMGYKYVQVSGTCQYDAKWLKNELDKNGLKCVLTHIPVKKLTEETEAVAKDHDIFECNNVGLGCYTFDESKTEESFENYFNTFIPVADTLSKNGKYFMHHHHEHEFQKRDGKLVIEHMVERFPADKLGITLDTFWIQASGGDPAQWIEILSGRVPCIHLKDFAHGKTMSVIGEGNINFDRVFEKAETSGTKYMLVEQDNCNGENPFDCLKRSYEFLKSRGFN